MYTIGVMAAGAGSLMAIASLILLIIKPLRAKFKNWLSKKVENEHKEKCLEMSISQIVDGLDSIQEELRGQEEVFDELRESLLCMTRNTLTHLHRKYMEADSIPYFERSNFSMLYDRYIALGGNSYIKDCYDDIMNKPVKY